MRCDQLKQITTYKLQQPILKIAWKFIATSTTNVYTSSKNLYKIKNDWLLHIAWIFYHLFYVVCSLMSFPFYNCRSIWMQIITLKILDLPHSLVLVFHQATQMSTAIFKCSQNVIVVLLQTIINQTNKWKLGCPYIWETN